MLVCHLAKLALINDKFAWLYFTFY